MNSLTVQLAILTVTFARVTAYAKYSGNENRDVAFLGGFTGLMGLCTAVAAMV